MKLGDLQTPALLVEADAFQHNLRSMAEVLPGARLRPHVKAHKCTALAARQASLGHRSFTCATIREVEGMAKAGLGDDLLLANEVVDARRLSRVEGRVTLAVDSEETVDVAARDGLREIVIDVNVGLPRCGCKPQQAGALADRARKKGLLVRGVMGYEGHAMPVEDRAKRQEMVAQSMEILVKAHGDVGRRADLGGWHGQLRFEPLGQRDPGWLLRPHGHGLREARASLPAGALHALHRDLGERGPSASRTAA